MHLLFRIEDVAQEAQAGLPKSAMYNSPTLSRARAL